MSLRRPPDRYKTDLDPLIQRACDPAQHRQGVALVIGILKAADDRCGGAYELGELSLGEGRRCPQFVDFAGDLFVRARLFQVLHPGWFAFVGSAVKDLHRIASRFQRLCFVNGISSLLICVLRRIRLKPLLALDGAIDLFRRDYALFRNTVRDHRRNRAVKEVQDPVVNAAQADAQFVDSVAQEVRFGSTQFVADLAQALQPEVATCPALSPVTY